jgi:hypothetical protein
MKEATPGKWITEYIDLPSGTAAVIETRSFIDRQYFWLDSPNSLIFLHAVYQGIKPAGCHFGIIIQKRYKWASHILYPEIAAPGETEVVLALHNLHLREAIAHHLQTRVPAPIIHNHHG